MVERSHPQALARPRKGDSDQIRHGSEALVYTVGVRETQNGNPGKDVTYTYGTDGKLATVLYPDATLPYTYTYDLMDRPTKMTGPSFGNSTNTIDHVRNVAYGVAGQVTSMQILHWENQDGSNYDPLYFTETKTYDELFQLTRIQSLGMAVSYNFSATANNGRITSRVNNSTGQTVTYQYDELNRLIQACICIR